MTQEQKEKKAAINRLNDRLRQIELRFGEDSAPAKDYRAKMEKLGGEYTLPTGRISKSTKALDSMSMQDIKAMERQKTAGDLMSSWGDYISEVEKIDKSKISSKDIIDYYENSKKVREGLDALGDYESEAIRRYRNRHHKQKGKLTYDDLRRATTEWNKLDERMQRNYIKKTEKARKEAINKYYTGAPTKVAPPRTETTSRNIGRSRV